MDTVELVCGWSVAPAPVLLAKIRLRVIDPPMSTVGLILCTLDFRHHEISWDMRIHLGDAD